MPKVVVELKSLSENLGRNGFLGNQELLHAVLSVCSGLHRCRIAIDALDEVTEWPELLEAIKVLAASSSVSLLATSRRERDIEETLFDVMDYSVALRSTELQNDMGAYVVERLRMDSKLKRLPQSVKSRVEEVLTTKSNGMFRWVGEVEKALTTLPPTLDATYERILLPINQAHVRKARAALEFVILSKHPPTLVEVAEAAAVGSLDGSFENREENQLFEPEEILRICSSLLVFEDSVF